MTSVIKHCKHIGFYSLLKKGEINNMLLSLGLMLLSGMALAKIFEKLKLPSLIGMLLTGMLLGPYALDLIEVNILENSSKIRQIALIIILT
jgi:solute carrier family 9B (sodium/hydrogen exchanger), member 1/2